MSSTRAGRHVNPDRFRLSRAGILNVWQYDEQVFEFADGRLLLRGANGAGKSKTLEMLLPFALDADKLRITASARHHTSLLWLMTDAHEGNRTGYVWVEFARDLDDGGQGAGGQEVFTCGIGIRASSTASQATTWHFTCPRRVGESLLLEDDAGPLSKEACRAAVAPDGHFFDRAPAYKQHVGRELFGLDANQYDELLRLLYWLRQPQVGEEIEPAKLAEQLSQALPQVDGDAVRAAGEALDELTAFGEQIDRRVRAATQVARFAQAYAGYARGVVAGRATGFLDAHRELGRLTLAAGRADAALRSTSDEVARTEEALATTQRDLTAARARAAALESSPEARAHHRLLDLQAQAVEAASTAEQAVRLADREARRVADDERRVFADRDTLRAEVIGYATDGRDLAAAAYQTGLPPAGAVPPGTPAGVAVPAALVTPSLAAGTDVPDLVRALGLHADGLGSLRAGCGERLAAVEVVDESRRQAQAAGAQRAYDERRLAEAESRAEAEHGRREDAAAQARDAEQAFAADLDRWRADPAGVPVHLPELTATTIPGLAATARAAAADPLARHRAEQAESAAARVGAERARAGLLSRRAELAAQRDPAPPAPALARTPREPADGAPLWRLVEFPDDLGAADRAGLEAALEAAGLLDAWVRGDGSLLGADRLDVVLPVGPPAPGPTLADLLVVDVPAGCPVSADVASAALGRVSVAPTPAGGPQASAAAARVGVDGSWRLGPLHGRASKDVAQYVGATARAAERRRLLAAVDDQLEAVEREHADAREREKRTRERIAALEAWVVAVPDHQDLRAAWTRLDERSAALARAQDEARAAEESAQRSRAVAAERRRVLDDLATGFGLPTDADGLAVRREQLRRLDASLARHVERAEPLRRQLARWAQDWSRLDDAKRAAAELDVAAQAQQSRSGAVAARLATLQETVGAAVDELARRLGETRAAIEAGDSRQDSLQAQLGDLRERAGQARAAATSTRAALEGHEPIVADAAHRLAALTEVPGLVRSAVDESVATGDASARAGADTSADAGAAAGAFALARGVAPGAKVPTGVVILARRLAGVADATRTVDANGLYAVWQDVVNSDAADHEPRVVTVGEDLLAAVGRDEGGEQPVAVLAARLDAAVARDRELLTERERTLFEQHLVGDLGEVLRARRQEAEELVGGMNELLAGVTTTQGIAVRLQWQLRDDVPDDARRAVRLISRAPGALLPGERTELRDALHRLIEVSRAEAPEDSYTEHLARALDYRQWFAFRVRYTRPELDGRWQDLHRRSALSQGEQKVVCYLPLFAAAAAHFTSLAGAAPYAPRFVLLDDAFPKIDVRTHPLLFGLLVDLDLDFVLTSERLWGDHATVPSLAIYEALRDPGQRGIAQYRYRWDGARLQAVGA